MSTQTATAPVVILDDQDNEELGFLVDDLDETPVQQQVAPPVVQETPAKKEKAPKKAKTPKPEDPTVRTGKGYNLAKITIVSWACISLIAFILLAWFYAPWLVYVFLAVPLVFFVLRIISPETSSLHRNPVDADAFREAQMPKPPEWVTDWQTETAARVQEGRQNARSQKVVAPSETAPKTPASASARPAAKKASNGLPGSFNTFQKAMDKAKAATAAMGDMRTEATPTPVTPAAPRPATRPVTPLVVTTPAPMTVRSFAPSDDEDDDDMPPPIGYTATAATAPAARTIGSTPSDYPQEPPF